MLLRKYFRFSPADFSPEWVSNPAALSTSPKLKYKTFASFVTRLNTWSYVEIKSYSLPEQKSYRQKGFGVYSLIYVQDDYDNK